MEVSLRTRGLMRSSPTLICTVAWASPRASLTCAAGRRPLHFARTSTPQSPTRTMWSSRKRCLSVLTCVAGVIGSVLWPSNTSMATGQSWVAQSRPLLQLENDVLQVPHRSCEPVDARDHQGVAGLQEVEKQLQLGPAGAVGAQRVLDAGHLEASCLKYSALDSEVLVGGAHAAVAVKGHGTEVIRLARVWS